MSEYDQLYADNPAHFGGTPDDLLVARSALLDPARPVLDVGCGQGRNALYLASNGYEVEGVEPSTVAVEQLRRAAAGLGVRVHHGFFGEVELHAGCFGAAMSFGLIPDLRYIQIEQLVSWMMARVIPGGTMWLTGFTTDDPALPRIAAEWEMVAPHSFRSSDGRHRTYLEPGGVLGLAPGLEVVHHWEGLGPEHRHGDGPPERHGRFEAIFRVPRRASS